jgi:predicted MPP superfamily phosphohydrolase
VNLSRALIFITVVLAVSLSAHRYVWARLVRDPGWPASVSRVLTFAIVLLALAPVVAMMLTRFAPREVTGPLTSVAMIWLGSLLYVMLGLGISDVAQFVASKLSAVPPDAERRAFLAKISAGLVALVAGGIGIGGVVHMMRGPTVKRIRVPLAKLPQAHDGYRIVQLTDVHVGPTIGVDFIEKVVNDTNARNPDLIVITGDLVDGSVATLAEHTAPLARLRARDGVFFVTGNHEYYSGADEWIAHLTTLGIRTLRNERVRIGGDSGFDLAGVDDFRSAAFEGHGPDLERALAGRDESRALVLLAHQPKQAKAAAAAGVDLQLSGHTHAGQIRPFDALVRLEQPYLHGLYDVRAMKLYVSPGTGYWGPPMRVGTTSEITEITLVAQG